MEDAGASDEAWEAAAPGQAWEAGDPDETLGTASGQGAGAGDPAGDGRAAGSGERPAFEQLPAGPHFGTLVHAVLEGVDFQEGDLEGALARRAAEVLVEHPVPLSRAVGEQGEPATSGPALLAKALARAIETPLGPQFGERPLRALARRDRLDELSFELRLAGSGPAATISEVGDLVREWTRPGELLYDWAAGLTGPAGGLFEGPIGGHVTGSIDLVARTVEGGVPRFVVVDYKTNRLARPGGPWPDGDYGPAALSRAMVVHHYPLQALLYCVALHRYLRWKMPGYDPEVHVGGATYLFLRGMTGPGARGDGGSAPGVLPMAMPAGLIVEMSELLDGSRRRRGDGR